MIAILDYGLGNILAFVNAFKRLDVTVAVCTTKADLSKASKLILPGVGSFDHAMASLDRSDLRARLDELVLEREVPVLGVCVGMQMLGDSSEEGITPGLGWLPGRVRRLKPIEPLLPVKLPHMGWNDVTLKAQTSLFSKLEQSARFYFLHSYYFDCAIEENVIAEVEYGLNFAAAVRHKNIYGVQFHPEKSHHYGLQLLKNFAEI